MCCYNVAASDVSTLDDLDELEVYGSDSQQQTGAKITQYTFEVRGVGGGGSLLLLLQSMKLIHVISISASLGSLEMGGVGIKWEGGIK